MDSNSGVDTWTDGYRMDRVEKVLHEAINEMHSLSMCDHDGLGDVFRFTKAYLEKVLRRIEKLR